MLGITTMNRFVLREDGEIKTHIIELTVKGLKELENYKKNQKQL